MCPAVPPVQNSVRYMGTQLPFPGLVASAYRICIPAILRLSFPGGVKHNSSDHANKHQPDSSENQICPCSETHQTRSERLVAGGRQEMQSAVGQRLCVERRVDCIFLWYCVFCDCIHEFVERLIGGPLWRVRGRCNGVAHGGCVRACMELGGARGMAAVCEHDGQQGRAQVASSFARGRLG